MVFFFQSLYDGVKKLLRASRFAGRQYIEFQKVYSAGQKRQYGAINRGEMYEIAQGYAGPDVSPVPVFLSSDTTVICKKMGAHPITCEFVSFMCMYVHVCACIYIVLVSISEFVSIICMYVHVYASIYIVFGSICLYEG
jgi:hypothetical protein